MLARLCQVSLTGEWDQLETSIPSIPSIYKCVEIFRHMVDNAVVYLSHDWWWYGWSISQWQLRSLVKNNTNLNSLAAVWWARVLNSITIWLDTSIYFARQKNTTDCFRVAAMSRPLCREEQFSLLSQLLPAPNSPLPEALVVQGLQGTGKKRDCITVL